MPPPLTYTEGAQVLEVVGSILPIGVIALICSYPHHVTHFEFDLTRALRVACLIGNLARIDDLLEMGADPDSPGHVGFSPLDLANWLNRLDTIKHMLVYLDLPQHGLTRLVQEVSRGRSTVVWALLEMGVRDQLDEPSYYHVFRLACHFGTLHVVNVLVLFAPEFMVSSYEAIFVHAAVSANKYVIATYLREVAERERDRIVQDVDEYMLPEDYAEEEATDKIEDIGDEMESLRLSIEVIP